MKKLLIVLFLAFSFLSFAQKFKFKNEEVLVDGNLWMKYEGCGGFNTFCSLINFSNNEEVIFTKVIRVPGVEPRTSANSSGDLVYFEVSFLGMNKKIELQKIV
uniref:hypothetical protein n=1 Tax=Flavobacterium sp. TaxID=239 RepID=UPI00404B85C8